MSVAREHRGDVVADRGERRAAERAASRRLALEELALAPDLDVEHAERGVDPAGVERQEPATAESPVHGLDDLVEHAPPLDRRPVVLLLRLAPEAERQMRFEATRKVMIALPWAV